MKAVWSGSISWGLVNIPIKLYSAVESGRADFRLLCKEHKAPIRYKRVCEAGGEEVGWGDIVNGLELEKGNYFILTRDEVDKLKPEGKENLEILEFVDKTELEPIYYDKSYFAVPKDKSEKAYFLFKELLDEMGITAIGKFVMRNKEYICALQPFEEGMLLCTLHYHQYIRDIGEIVMGERPEIGVDEKELGKLLIEKHLKKEFHLEKFRDTFMERLKDLIRRKMEGKEIEIGELPKREEKSLVDALKASVGVGIEEPAIVYPEVSAKRMGRISREYLPMLCEKGIEGVLDEKGYIFEPKMDGTRCIAEVYEEVRLINRRGRDISKRYPEIVKELGKITHNCVLDGEIVCFNEEGVPDFNLLQKREQIDSDLLIEGRAKGIPATYVVFDILARGEEDLSEKPLGERKKILDETVQDAEHIMKIAYEAEGRKLWDEMRKKGMEGVIAKRLDSIYYSGRRRWDWLKLKNLKSIDVVLIGYTTEKREISALGMALYQDTKLVYIGSVGTGLTENLIKMLKREIKELKLKTDKAPVVNPEKVLKPKGMKWLEPHLVGEIQYLEMTGGGELRAPSFKGLRWDKPVEECSFDQLWKGRIEECIEIFNHEEAQPVSLYEHERLCEDYLIEQPTLLKGGSAIPYAWVKAKLEAYRMG
jgi:Ku protein